MDGEGLEGFCGLFKQPLTRQHTAPGQGGDYALVADSPFRCEKCLHAVPIKSEERG
jgi:hypothetical protein